MQLRRYFASIATRSPPDIFESRSVSVISVAMFHNDLSASNVVNPCSVSLLSSSQKTQTLAYCRGPAFDKTRHPSLSIPLLSMPLHVPALSYWTFGDNIYARMHHFPGAFVQQHSQCRHWWVVNHELGILRRSAKNLCIRLSSSS